MSVLTEPGTPSAGVPGNLNVPALVPDKLEVPADTPALIQYLITVLIREVPVWTLVKFQSCTHTVQCHICPVIVALAKDANGNPVVTRTLIDM